MGLNIVKKVLDRLAPIVPGKISGFLDFASGNFEFFYPYSAAMNGQTARLEITRTIIIDCNIQQIVETGTFRGSTTAWLAGFGLPVVTVELNKRYAAFSRLRFRHADNVRVLEGSSSDVLRLLSKDTTFTSKSTFFYLDAHWNVYSPLRDEIGIILERFPRSIIMVDDFQVPGDSSYDFDFDQDGRVVNLSHLSTLRHDWPSIFFPAIKGHDETGIRRGWVVLSKEPGIVKRLKLSHNLREYDVEHWRS
jgi:predicted O-methyltransferase YrrM